MKKLFLLDGHALVYRAHYAFITRPLMNSKGWNVSCISGFTRVLLDVMKKEKPTHLAVSFDLKGPTFRHEMFENYKANRDAQPEDISFGLPWIMKILRGMNIPIVTSEGFEADDVIGTLSKQAEREGFQVYMMTPDKDYGQLVSENIFMYKPAKNGNDAEVWGIKEVCENWGIERVEQVVDILGMQGDAVDNIPGLPGIGPKTAATLLAKYGTLEEVIAHTHELKGKQQDIFKNFAEQGLLSKKLAAIELNVPVTFHAADYKLSDYNKEELGEVFKELEFKTIAREVLGAEDHSVVEEKHIIKTAASKIGVQADLFGAITGGDAPVENKLTLQDVSFAEKNIGNTEHTYYLIDTPEKRAELITKLMQSEAVAYDSETTSIDANQAELVGMSFAVKDFEAFYVPFPKDKTEAQAMVEEFRPFFESATIRKIGQNLKYDLIVLKWYNVEMSGVYFDTMLAHYLIEPDLRHNMNYMSATILKYEPVSIETLIGKGKNQLSMRDVNVEKVKEYAAEDADITFQLYEKLKGSLSNTEGVNTLFETIEMPLVEVLTQLEYNGVRVDADYLNKFSLELELKVSELENKIYELAGARFNIGSPKQVGDILFDVLKIPYRWKKRVNLGSMSQTKKYLQNLLRTTRFVKLF